MHRVGICAETTAIAGTFDGTVGEKVAHFFQTPTHYLMKIQTPDSRS